MEPSVLPPPRAPPKKTSKTGQVIRSVWGPGWGDQITWGSFIDRSAQLHLKELTKKDIIAYSAGFVDDYKVISEQRQGSMVKVVMDVSVSSNKINDRVLAKSSNTQNFNGDKYGNQYQTIIKERNDGERVLQNILNDY